MTAPDRPVAAELADAVREFLESEVLPLLDDRRLRFRLLVAMNALSIVSREAPPPSPLSDEQRELATRIRRGDVRPGDLALIHDQVREKLSVASPRYLERYEAR